MASPRPPLPPPDATTRIIYAHWSGTDARAITDGLIGPGRAALVAVGDLARRGGGRVVLVAETDEGFVAAGLRRLVECLDQAGAADATRVFMTVGRDQLARITTGGHDASAGRFVDQAGAPQGLLRIGGGPW
jgi:hypothetical protein